MKLSHTLAFGAVPLVLNAAPIASSVASPDVSATPIAAPGFSIRTELSSNDMEKCRLPSGGLDQACATELVREFNDIAGKYRAFREMQESNDVDDQFVSELPSDVQRRQLIAPQIEDPAEQPGDCGTWTDHMGESRDIPQDYCEMLNQYSDFKQPEEGEEGDCGVWQDTYGETFPLDFYTCGMLEQQTFNPTGLPMWPLPDQPDGEVAAKLGRRQVHLPPPRPFHDFGESKPRDCGNWSDVYKRPQPIPERTCEFLQMNPTAKKTHSDEVGDCGNWTDVDGKAYPIHDLICTLLWSDLTEKNAATTYDEPMIDPILHLPDVPGDGPAGGLERRQMLPPPLFEHPDPQPGDCGNWTDAHDVSRAIPKDVCTDLRADPSVKTLNDSDIGTCGEWYDADEESFPISKSFCRYLEIEFNDESTNPLPYHHACIFDPECRALLWPDPEPWVPDVGFADELERRQVDPPQDPPVHHLDARPGDCGNWIDRNKTSHPIPQELCDDLRTRPYAKAPATDIGDGRCGNWTDADGKSYPIVLGLVCDVLEAGRLDWLNSYRWGEPLPSPPFDDDDGDDDEDEHCDPMLPLIGCSRLHLPLPPPPPLPLPPPMIWPEDCVPELGCDPSFASPVAHSRPPPFVPDVPTLQHERLRQEDASQEHAGVEKGTSGEQ